MDFLIKLAVSYFSFSVVVVATCWYLAPLIQRQWPAWWKQVVVDVEPDSWDWLRRSDF